MIEQLITRLEEQARAACEGVRTSFGGVFSLP